MKHILVIDDNTASLALVRENLKEYYKVTLVTDGKQALRFLEKKRPDLILLDYQMPLYNGVALLSMIRQNERAKDVPVIILSGSLNPEALVEFYAYNPTACLAKTVGKDVLLEKIKQALMSEEG